MTAARAHLAHPRPIAGQRGITLVELLVAMTIMSVITAMLLMGWFALQRSYGFTTHSADARDSGRQAIQRMQREIRDAQKPPQGYLGTSSSGAPDAIVFRARAYWIAFSSTFNDAATPRPTWIGATPTPSPSAPLLVVYRLYKNGQLWRFEDVNRNGKIDRTSGGTIDMSGEYPTDFGIAETQDGEGASWSCPTSSTSPIRPRERRTPTRPRAPRSSTTTTTTLTACCSPRPAIASTTKTGRASSPYRCACSWT